MNKFALVYDNRFSEENKHIAYPMLSAKARIYAGRSLFASGGQYIKKAVQTVMNESTIFDSNLKVLQEQCIDLETLQEVLSDFILLLCVESDEENRADGKVFPALVLQRTLLRLRANLLCLCVVWEICVLGVFDPRRRLGYTQKPCALRHIPPFADGQTAVIVFKALKTN